jgi:hypothetical protein
MALEFYEALTSCISLSEVVQRRPNNALQRRMDLCQQDARIRLLGCVDLTARASSKPHNIVNSATWALETSTSAFMN